MNTCYSTVLGFLSMWGSLIHVNAQTTTQWGPDGYVKIENGSGGFSANLDLADRFSRDHDVIGDVNGDGILDLVVGARSDDDGATDAGAVYILFMNENGTVQSNQKISQLDGNFSDTLTEGNFFGYGVAGIGDYDDDNIPDIAVSAPTPPNRAIYIIHLNSDGTVKDLVKNTNITAQGLSAVGDLNQDGRIDLAACDPGSDVGGTNIGAIRIIFLNNNSQIMPAQTVFINSQSGALASGLQPGDEFGGREVANLGDLDSDGTIELAVGAFMSDSGKGAIWILSLDSASLEVVSALKITEGLNGFNDELTSESNPNGTLGANFGHSLCKVGDLNGDGIPDLMTGANQQNEGVGYILYLNEDKTVKTYTRISHTDGGFGLILDPEERFSRSISCVGDLRGDGSLAVNYGGGAGGTGTLYLLFFKPCEFTSTSVESVWNQGNILYSNWNPLAGMLTDDSLTFEQCSFKAFENNASYMNYNEANGSCVCLDQSAVLTQNTEGVVSYSNACYNQILPIKNATEHIDIQLFPNPVHSNLTIQIYEFTTLEEYLISIYSADGRSIYSQVVSNPSPQVILSEYSSGIYLLTIETKGRRESLKFILE